MGSFALGTEAGVSVERIDLPTEVPNGATGAARPVSAPNREHPAASPRTLWPRLAGTAVVLIGGAVMVGWILDLDRLTRVAPSLPPMHFNSALCLSLMGVALVLGIGNHGAVILAGAVASIAAFSLLEYLAGTSLGIDQLIVDDGQTRTHPGRMAITTAFCLLLAAVSVFASRYGERRAAQVLALMVFGAGWLTSLAYLFDVEELREVGPFSRVSLHMGLALVLLAFGLLSSVPGGTVPWILDGRDPGASLLRRLLPMACIALPLAGEAVAEGLHADAFGPEFGTAIMVIVAAAAVTIAGLVGANAIRHHDEHRRAAVESLAVAEDEERERIAIEIHDETIQHLIGARLYVEALHRRMLAGRLTEDEATDRLEAIQVGMTAAITSVRDVIFDLAPPHLDGGLIEATTLLVKRLFGDTDTIATVGGENPGLAAREAQLVYRIVAEALRNVQRHAHASTVQVDFERRPAEIVVTVRDDGTGFPDAGVEHRPGHLGLRTMEERAQALGGTCTIAHRPGGGTVVALRLDPALLGGA